RGVRASGRFPRRALFETGAGDRDFPIVAVSVAEEGFGSRGRVGACRGHHEGSSERGGRGGPGRRRPEHPLDDGRPPTDDPAMKPPRATLLATLLATAACSHKEPVR